MGFILLFPAQTFNSTTWFGFNSWAVAKPFSENIIKLLGSVTHIKTHKQHAGLQPRTRQRDKANSNLFTACLPNSTSYSSQMANPTTEAVIFQLPLTHRGGEEPEQRQDTERWGTWLVRACSIRSLVPSAAACSWRPGYPVLICHENYTSSKVWSWMHIYLLLTGWFLFLFFFLLFLNECPFTAYLRIRPKMFRKNMPSLNFYLFIQNKQSDLLRYKFACVHDLKSIVGSVME